MGWPVPRVCLRLLFWDQAPRAPWARPVTPGTVWLLRSTCPSLALIWGGHLCAKTRGWRHGGGSLPDAPTSAPLLLSVATHPSLKAVAFSPHLYAKLSPVSSFSVIPPAFCLLGIPYNFWLTEGTPSSFFSGYLFCPSWETWKQMCAL